jgi:hypothetical protein
MLMDTNCEELVEATEWKNYLEVALRRVAKTVAEIIAEMEQLRGG